jgi:hypothetical protein
MNCPSCSAPLLFGATGCDCGYHVSRFVTSPIDLSYWEALNAFWRIYWPAQLFGMVGLFLITRGALKLGTQIYRIEMANQEVGQFLIQTGLGAIALFLFIHRIVSLPYKSFKITLVGTSSQLAANKRLTLHQRFNLFFFVWWRQMVAGLLVFFLAGPLNILIGLIGLRSIFGLNPRFLVSVLASALAVGPILMKMLVAHQFPTFRVEVTRPPQVL